MGPVEYIQDRLATGSGGRGRYGLLTVAVAFDLIARAPLDVLTPILSVLGGLAGSGETGFVTTWLVFFSALLLLAPSAYEHLTVLPTKAYGFRTIFAICTVILGIIIQQAKQPNTLLLTVLPGMFIAGGLLLVYLVSIHDWELFDPEGSATAVLGAMTPHGKAKEEIETDLSYDGWLGRVSASIYILTVAAIIALPVVIAAFALQILIYTFPLPDFIFLGWILAVRVIPPAPIGPGRDRVVGIKFDLEEFLLDTIENAPRSTYGMYATCFAILGMFLAGGYLFLAVVVSTQVAEILGTVLQSLGTGLSFDAMLVVWNWVGLLCLPFVAGSHGIWIWVRELQRLPHFLDQVEERQTIEDPLSARVTGFVAVPIGLWFLSAGYLYIDIKAMSATFAVCWPVGLVLAGWTVDHTYRRTPQSATNEYTWIVAGLVAQSLALVSGVNFQSIIAAILTKQAPTALALPVAIIVVAMLAAVIPILLQYERKQETWRQYLFVIFLIILGTLGALSYSFVPEGYRLFSLGFCLVGWGAGGLTGVIRWYDL